MMRFLITGASGQLGSAVVDRLSRDGVVCAMTRNELDITRDGDVARVFRDTRPDAVVNCSAYNHVDQAETEASQALDVNAFGVLNLARAAHATGAVLVHYSYRTSCSTARRRGRIPRAIRRHRRATTGDRSCWVSGSPPTRAFHYVLRVESLFGGRLAKSSVDRILDAMRQGQPARVFVDRTVTPSYVVDVAEATVKILQSRPAPGLYHCVNSGITTWLGVAEEAARLMSLTPTIVPVEVASISFPAKRPVYCALSNEKLGGAGIHMPDWRDALARYVAGRG